MRKTPLPISPKLQNKVLDTKLWLPILYPCEDILMQLFGGKGIGKDYSRKCIPFQILLIWSPSQAPCQFDDELVLRQLRYTGMVETVKIRKAGYSVRMTFEVCALTHTYKKYGNAVNMCDGNGHILDS